MNTESDFDRIMERHAVRQQVEEYIDALNHRDWVRFENTIAENLVWSIGAPFDVRLESREAMMHCVRTLQEPVYDFVFQMGHGIVVHELEGDFARVRHTIEEVSNDFHMIGVYYDELRKEADGVWRFTRRDYRPTYVHKGNVRGKVYRRLPDAVPWELAEA